MIAINDINFAYRKKSGDIFSHLSFEIGKGKVCGLLGKNGAGKSTLLYIMSGLLKAQSGQVLINGKDIAKRNAETLSEIFLVSDEFELPAISLNQFIQIQSPFYPKFDKALMEECLREFGLPTDLNLAQLSMGQKKKVYMCFALATNVDLLLMDEPTNGLDIPSKSQFRKVISRCMTDERTIVISTHQVKDVELLLDQIIILDNSRILLNEESFHITEKLAFKLASSSEMPAEILYSQSAVMGQAVVIPNCNDEDTNMDLELLFNATISNPEGINNQFKH